MRVKCHSLYVRVAAIYLNPYGLKKIVKSRQVLKVKLHKTVFLTEGSTSVHLIVLYKRYQRILLCLTEKNPRKCPSLTGPLLLHPLNVQAV